MTWSDNKKNTEANTAMSTTIMVVISVSRREGHVTFWVSERTCCKNSKGLVLAILSYAGAKPLGPPA
jgi:hypothetical protein